MNKHGGKIYIANKLLLDILGFSGGKIHYAGVSDYRLDEVTVVIEHPDMPEIPEGMEVPIVFPVHRITDLRGYIHGVFTTRVDPELSMIGKIKEIFKFISWILRRTQ